MRSNLSDPPEDCHAGSCDDRDPHHLTIQMTLRWIADNDWGDWYVLSDF